MFALVWVGTGLVCVCVRDAILIALKLCGFKPLRRTKANGGHKSEA